MSSRRNRTGNRVEKKRKKQPRLTPVAKKPQVLSWDDLAGIAKHAAKLLGYTYAHYEYFKQNRKEFIEKNTIAREGMDGLAKMIKDHAEQLQKLAYTHTQRDENGEFIVIDGKAKLKTGKFKTPDEGFEASQIVLEYQNEMEGIEPLFDTVLPEVASTLGLPKDVIDQLLDVSETNKKVMSNVTGKLDKSYTEYNKTFSNFKQEQTELLAELDERIKKNEEDENGGERPTEQPAE